MKNKTPFYILIAIAVAIAGYAIYKSKSDMAPATPGGYTTTPTESTATPTTTTTPSTQGAIQSTVVQLAAQNDSGETGTATLTQQSDGKTKVVIDLTGAPKATPQPAHIHVGACPNPGAVKYPLSNVVNGKSTTTIDASYAQLKASLPLAINVHKSVKEASVYVACGDLKI